MPVLDRDSFFWANDFIFRADDLIPEESELVQQAIKRLPPKVAYDRVFRLRRAFQVRRAYFRDLYHS